jgi:hypothetical protein
MAKAKATAKYGEKAADIRNDDGRPDQHAHHRDRERANEPALPKSQRPEFGAKSVVHPAQGKRTIENRSDRTSRRKEIGS